MERNEWEWASVGWGLKGERETGFLQNSGLGELPDPAVMRVSTYQGPPTICCSRILSSAATGASSATSSSVVLPGWWCRTWPDRQEKYGLIRAEWMRKPTGWATNSFGEKAPWPHSCARTQSPVRGSPAR